MGRGWRAPTASDSASAPSLPQAIGTLFDDHAARLLEWFQLRTQSREVAADLVAETFAAALEGLDGFDPSRGDQAGWLWGIGKNTYRQLVRSAEVEQRARQRLAIRTPSVDSDEVDRANHRLDARRLVGELDVLLGSLSDSTAMAVRLRVIDELPYDAVASRCGCSVGAARVRVARGLATLADQVGSNEADEAEEASR